MAHCETGEVMDPGDRGVPSAGKVKMKKHKLRRRAWKDDCGMHKSKRARRNCTNKRSYFGGGGGEMGK